MAPAFALRASTFALRASADKSVGKPGHWTSGGGLLTGCVPELRRDTLRVFVCWAIRDVKDLVAAGDDDFSRSLLPAFPLRPAADKSGSWTNWELSVVRFACPFGGVCRVSGDTPAVGVTGRISLGVLPSMSPGGCLVGVTLLLRFFGSCPS